MGNLKTIHNIIEVLKRFKLAFIIIIFLNISFNSLAQINAEELFDDYCYDCHSIGEGDMLGPDLLGVEQKYSNDWLLKFIKSSKTMINNEDPQAIAIYEKYKKKKMPDTPLSNAEIQALIDYIKSFNKSKTIVDTKTSIVPGIKKSTDLKKTGQVPKDAVLETREYDERLEVIEKKLDMILRYHKKSLSARITDEEIRKGEELFEGTVPFTERIQVCATCHNTYKTDTLNWNPSALDIATAFSKRNDIDMDNLIINPVSDKMKEVLKDHKLTDDETFYLTAFLQNVERTGLKEEREYPVQLFIFLVLCLISTIGLLNIFFRKIIKSKLINLSIFLIPGAFVVKILFTSAANLGLSQNYAPDQPIKFSHKIHVKDNKIVCLFCHNSPEYSRESGIPTTNVCMLCHNKIKSGIMTGRFEINKIIKSYKEKRAIEWIKIHNLPDHVFFSHAQHVSVAKIECQTCHGKIEEMHVTSQYATLSMGWCVKCHRESIVQFEENKYYSKHEELHNDLRTGKIDKVTADKIGANDCQKCHY